jgi:predicted ArsR family transcriptional regulator
MADEWVEQVAGIGALAEPARRELYRYVAGQPDPVSREQAAQGVGMALHSAKFHLDKLVDEGLLTTEFRRLSGRGGPGAGRPSKLYRRAEREIAVTLPERRYVLAGEVMAAAIDRAVAQDEPVTDSVRNVARQRGRDIGERATADETSELRRTAEVLAEHGYEPRHTDSEVSLANCPFDQLATDHTALVCGMNLALIDGVVEGLGCQHVAAELAPQEGFCCVRLRATV